MDESRLIPVIGSTIEQDRAFLAACRREKIKYCEAEGLPIPAFDKVEDFILPDGFWYKQNGIPRRPKDSNRLTWVSKSGEVVLVSRDGWAVEDGYALRSRLKEALQKLYRLEHEAEGMCEKCPEKTKAVCKSGVLIPCLLTLPDSKED